MCCKCNSKGSSQIINLGEMHDPRSWDSLPRHCRQQHWLTVCSSSVQPRRNNVQVQAPSALPAPTMVNLTVHEHIKK